MMTREDELAAVYTRCRARLTRIAYALVGTQAEAEDVVSDCWLRLVKADQKEHVHDVEAWATVTVAHAALDVLRSARVRREEYVGPWLPEPLIGKQPPNQDPAEQTAFHETVSFAVMVVLETLTPAERTSWALRELFGLPYDEIADVVGRTPAAVRQLAARARAHIAVGAPRVHVETGQHQEAVAAFTRAATAGDLDGLLKILDPSVKVTADGGGKVTAARHPVRGAERVSRYLVGIAQRIKPHERLVPVTVNGGPGFILVDDDHTVLVCALTIQNRLITRADFVLTPDKLPKLVDTPSRTARKLNDG
ncbi:RNA polymerase sigma factor SigJ [Saccharopolyspora sp. 5N708]|uniref:RNA polymerase sigma factor SigJ n=1 Tax=Saccharopolyspora sp. 5N708 TaxID=3457424 RepID=UPI003FD0F1E5